MYVSYSLLMWVLQCFVEKVIPLLDRCEICMNILKSFSECYLSPKRKKDQAKLSMYTPPRNHTLTLMVVGSINEKVTFAFNVY